MIKMKFTEQLKRPNKEEQALAQQSFKALRKSLKVLNREEAEIEIEETKERIRLPLHALELLAEILKVTAEGKPVSIVPVATELTTQAAAEFLSCSRPHLVKLLESGEIPFTKVGKHRRVLFEELVAYKNRIKAAQEQRIIKMMRQDEDLGLYDT